MDICENDHLVDHVRVAPMTTEGSLPSKSPAFSYHPINHLCHFLHLLVVLFPNFEAYSTNLLLVTIRTPLNTI